MEELAGWRRRSHALALVAAGCGGGGGSEPEPGTSQGGGTGGEISIRSCTPQNPLIPANTNETCGGNLLDAIDAKLVHYNADTAAPELDIAESIETKDNQTFTVKLKPGYKFHDGTEVKAKNFVDAWNWNAYGPNGNLNAYFFEPIAGYDDLQCGTNSAGEADCEGKPAKAKEMSGLKVVDDHTFTIKTTDKVSNLPVRLGYTAFAPLPDSFFSDPKAYRGEADRSGSVQAGQQDRHRDGHLEVRRLLRQVQAKRGQGDLPHLQRRRAPHTTTSWRTTSTSPTKFRPIGWSTTCGSRNCPTAMVCSDSGTIATTTYSPIDDNFKDIRMRQALSMAIDRDLINKQIFNGIRPPLDGFVSPVVDGFKAGACGEWCKFNPTEAKKLYEEAGGYKGGPLTISVNGDSGGHKAWADAACNSIKNTLGLDCITKVTPDFKTLRDQIVKREIKGLFRTGWQMDYPSIENFLAPLYATGASSNDGDYSNPKFDAKLKEAAAAPSLDEANKLYQEAEAMLGKDFPVMPMWSYQQASGWSDRVTDVKVTPFGTIDLTSIKVK